MKKKLPVKIVILQRGWVYVGRFLQKGERCQLTDAKCIRQWGTTKGLGQLVPGPTDETILDPAGTVTFHELTSVAILDVEEKGWAKHL